MLYPLPKRSQPRSRTGAWAVLMVTTGFFTGAASPAAGEDKKPADELNGTWKLVSVERSEETEPLRQNVQWVVQDRRASYGGESLGTVVYDSASSPKIFDLSLRETEQTYEGLYELENDVLKICLNVQAIGTQE